MTEKVFERALREALDVVEELLTWSRVGTFDEAPGEREAEATGKALLARFRDLAPARSEESNDG